MKTALKALLWSAGVVLALALIVFAGSFFIDRPIRAAVEREMNAHLHGYSVRLGGTHFQPIGLSLTLRDVKIIHLYVELVGQNQLKNSHND